MRVSCPNCAAEYEVPSARMHPRRKVKCARCATVWMPVHDAESVTDDGGIPDPLDGPRDISPRDPRTNLHDDPADAPHFEPAGTGGATAMDRLAAASAPRPSISLRAAWVASVVLLVISVAATMTWRSRIVQAWPASALLLGSAGPHAAEQPQAAPRGLSAALTPPAARRE